MTATTIQRERIATLKDKRRIAAEALDKVADQIDRTGMTAMLRWWRTDLTSQINAIDQQIKTMSLQRRAPTSQTLIANVAFCARVRRG